MGLPSTEKAQQVVPLVGGPLDGKAYRGRDLPNEINFPLRPNVKNLFGVHETLHMLSARYRRAEIRLGGWETRFVYYHHEDLREEEASLALFGFMWKAMNEKAHNYRAALCPLCDGTGLDG